MTEHVDILWVTIMWGPAVWMFFAGWALLLSGSMFVRGFAWIIPGAWAVLCVMAAIWAMDNGMAQYELTDVVKYQAGSLALLSMFFMFVHGIMGLVEMLRRERRREIHG